MAVKSNLDEDGVKAIMRTHLKTGLGKRERECSWRTYGKRFIVWFFEGCTSRQYKGMIVASAVGIED